MKNIPFLFILLLSYLISGAQTKLDKAYFITNEGVKTECLTKHKNWSKSPSEFVYQLSEKSLPLSVGPNDVIEFGIDEGPKFISEMVDIDMSEDDEKNVSTQKDPEWSTQRLFLKVLVEGQASLYQYQIPSMDRYFYKIKNSKISQLVYKKFLPDPEEKFQFKTNVLFRQQLWTEVRIFGMTIEEVQKLNYEKSDLIPYFVQFNKESNEPYKVYTKKREKGAFHLRVTPGRNLSYASVTNHVMPDLAFDFGRKFGFRIGIEPELIFPYTNRKLGLVIEPTFQYYNGTETSGTQTMFVHLYTIEFPLGLRYYFFLNKDLTIF